MKNFFKAALAAFFVSVALVAHPHRVEASCTLPYPSTPIAGSNASASQVWGNFNALATCTGLSTASAIIPMSSAQATFGGGYPYVFPLGLSSSGGAVPPMYTPSGTSVASTAHSVLASGACSSTSTTNGPFTGYVATVSLTIPAQFASVSTSATSFVVGDGAALAANNYWMHDFRSFVVEWNSATTLYVRCGAASQPFSFIAEGT